MKIIGASLFDKFQNNKFADFKKYFNEFLDDLSIDDAHGLNGFLQIISNSYAIGNKSDPVFEEVVDIILSARYTGPMHDLSIKSLEVGNYYLTKKIFENKKYQNHINDLGKERLEAPDNNLNDTIIATKKLNYSVIVKYYFCTQNNITKNEWEKYYTEQLIQLYIDNNINEDIIGVESLLPKLKILKEEQKLKQVVHAEQENSEEKPNKIKIL